MVNVGECFCSTTANIRYAADIEPPRLLSPQPKLRNSLQHHSGLVDNKETQLQQTFQKTRQEWRLVLEVVLCRW